MTISSWVLAAALGFVQGYVAFASTVVLSKRLAAVVVGDSSDGLGAEGSPPRLPLSSAIARGVSFIALVLLHLSVLEILLGALSGRDPDARWVLGRAWIYAMLAGLVLSRVLPALEARLTGRGRR